MNKYSLKIMTEESKTKEVNDLLEGITKKKEQLDAAVRPLPKHTLKNYKRSCF